MKKSVKGKVVKEESYNHYQICNILGIQGVNANVVKIKFLNKRYGLSKWKTVLIENKLFK